MVRFQAFSESQSIEALPARVSVGDQSADSENIILIETTFHCAHELEENRRFRGSVLRVGFSRRDLGVFCIFWFCFGSVALLPLLLPRSR